MIITQTFTMARWQIVVKKSEATNKPKTKRSFSSSLFQLYGIHTELGMTMTNFADDDDNENNNGNDILFQPH